VKKFKIKKAPLKGTSLGEAPHKEETPKPKATSESPKKESPKAKAKSESPKKESPKTKAKSETPKKESPKPTPDAPTKSSKPRISKKPRMPKKAPEASGPTEASGPPEASWGTEEPEVPKVSDAPETPKAPNVPETPEAPKAPEEEEEEENLDYAIVKPKPVIERNPEQALVKIKITKKANKAKMLDDLWNSDVTKPDKVTKKREAKKYDPNDIKTFTPGRNIRMIHEKKWYYKIKSEEEAKEEEEEKDKDSAPSDALAVEKKRAPQKKHSLLDEHPKETLPGKLIVCLKAKGKQKDVHYFAVFKDFIEFGTYQEKVQAEDRCFYEVIFGDHMQKPHFDIDIDQDTLDELLSKMPSTEKQTEEDEDSTITDSIPTDTSDGQDFPDEDPGFEGDNFVLNHRSLGDYMLSTLITHLIKIFKKKGIVLKPQDDILVYSSHRANKTSYHLIINNYCHQNHLEAKQLHRKALKHIKQDMKSKGLEILKALPYEKIIDSSVYSSLQQFRIVGSHKPGTNYDKVFIKHLQVGNFDFVHKYVEDPDDEDHERIIILDESLITNVNSCITLPPFSGKTTYPEYRQNNRALMQQDVTKDMARFAINMLATNSGITPEDRRFPFKFMTIKGGLVLLKRIRPSRCSLCSRVHENDNPYLIIGGDGSSLKRPVYYHCRRSPITEKKFLGEIDDELYKSKLEEWAQMKITDEILKNTNVPDPWLIRSLKAMEDTQIISDMVDEESSSEEEVLDYVVIKKKPTTIERVMDAAAQNMPGKAITSNKESSSIKDMVGIFKGAGTRPSL